MVRLFSNIYDLILPRTCHICGTQLDSSERFVCSTCLSQLPRTGYHSIEDNRFEERFAGKFPFDRGASLFFYEKQGNVAQIVHDFKYRGFQGLAREMGRIMGHELLPTGFLDDLDVIVPVGMNLLKKWRREYNQAEELAFGLAEVMNEAVGTIPGRSLRKVEVVDCLSMSRWHTSQTRRSEAERAGSVRNIFRIKKNYNLDGARVLLLDDICTTGSTMTAAAETITSAATKIRLRLLTLASTY